MLKKIILIGILLLASFLAAACQTVSGIGGDIQWSAEKVSDVLEGN